MNNKKILSLLLAAVLFTPTTFAAESVSTEQIANLTNLHEAFELMLKNNRDIQLAELDIQLTESRKVEALNEKIRYQNYINQRTSDQNLLSYLTKVLITPASVENNLKQSKRTLELLKSEKQRTLKNYIATYTTLNTKITSLKKQVANKQSELNGENLKFSKGLSTKSAVSLIDINLSTLEENLSTYESERDNLELELENLMGVDHVIVNMSIENSTLYPPLEVVDYGNLYKSLSLKDNDVLKLAEAVSLATAEYDLANLYPIDGTDLVGSKSDMLKAQKTYENGLASLKVKIQSDYLTLKKKYQTILIKELTVQSAEISLKSSQAYLKAGKTTELAYLTELENLNMLKIELDNAILDYNTAFDEYMVFISQK